MQMEKIKTAWRRFAQWAASTDKGQRQALRRVGAFFGAMLLCMLVARGASGAAMARVKLESPTAQTLEEQIQLSGSIEAAAPLALETPEGLTVVEVPAAPGQQVKAGDTLARVDEQQLADAVRRQQAQVQKQQLALDALGEDKPLDSSALDSAKTALEQARADEAKANQRAAQAVANAETALENAKAARQAAADRLAALEKDPAASLEMLEQARTALAGAEADCTAAQQALDTACQAAADTAESGRRSVAGAETGLQSAQKGYDEAAKQAQKDKQNAQADAILAQLELEKSKKALEQLQALAAAGGCITAPADGTLVQLDFAPGQPTAAQNGLLAGQSGGFVFKGSLPAAQSEKLAPGAKVNVAQGFGGGTGVVQALQPGEQDTVEITVRLNEDAGWKIGGAEAGLVLSRQQYFTCLPVTAVRGGDSSYVLVMEQRTTILGVQNVLVKIPVTVEKTSNGTAAVSGALANDAKVVVQSSRPVEDGDRVRVME